MSTRIERVPVETPAERVTQETDRVSVAFRVGFLLVGIPLSGAFDVLARSSTERVVDTSIILVGLQLVPVALGIAIGVPIGKKLEQRLQQ